MQVQVTGALTAVAPARVAVGRTSCAVPRSLEGRAGRFVVSDPVRIFCVGGKLRSIVYSPPPANQSTKVVPVPPAPAAPAHPAPQYPPPGCCSSYSAQTIVLGGDAAPVYRATGRLDELAADHVFVGGLTCTLRPSFAKALLEIAHVGDQVTITCDGGDTLMRIATVRNS